MKWFTLVGLLSVSLTLSFPLPSAMGQLPPLGSPPGAGIGFGNGPANGVGLGNNGADNNGGAGGGSMADFDSLMTLIQQTIEPDVWEALGGVSTMAPYPQGVLVDGNGLLREVESATRQSEDHAAAIASMLATNDDSQDVDSDDWRQPAKIRCVSIRRMMQALAGQAMVRPLPNPQLPNRQPQAADDAFRFMAGLSKITVVIVTPDDLILAGTVGGFEEVAGWTVDAQTGLPTINLVSLAVGLTASRTKTPYGCTIDPSTVGLQNAAALGQRLVAGEIPMVTAAGKLADALGRQAITVFGTSSNHEIAHLMVEADRHMKQLALGDEPMPTNVRNYLQTMAMTGDGTPPTDLLLRLWFKAQPIDMRTAEVESNQIIQLAGTPLQLSGQNELALATGQRGNVVVDPATLAFVEHFNQNWSEIRTRYPIYGALESVYTATAIAELWTRRAHTGDHAFLQRALMYFAAEQARELPTPKEVDSIAVFHRYKRGRKRHQVLLASGGVKVSPMELVPEKSPSYPGLRSIGQIADQRPFDRWWWNGQLEEVFR